jgi:hypothetical protein
LGASIGLSPISEARGMRLCQPVGRPPGPVSAVEAAAGASLVKAE